MQIGLKTEVHLICAAVLESMFEMLNFVFFGLFLLFESASANQHNVNVNL